MNKVSAFLLLTFFSSLLWATSFAGDWLQHPIARMALVSYFKQKERSGSEKAIEFLDQLERATLDRPPLYVRSLEEYLAIRNDSANSMTSYWQKVMSEGLINPLNIRTTDDVIFEKILEYEVQEAEKMLRGIPEAMTKASPELQGAMHSIQLAIETFKVGVGLRSRLDEATKSWANIPFLNLLRFGGEVVVNPAARAAAYSGPVLDIARNQFRKQMARARRDLIHSDWTTRTKNIGQLVGDEFFQTGFLKLLQGVDKKIAFELASSFFKALPNDVVEEFVWLWMKDPKLNRVRISDLFKGEQVLSEKILDHFLIWIKKPQVVSETRRLSNLPIAELAYSLAFIQKENFLRSANEPLAGPKYLGEAIARSMFKPSIRFEFESVSVEQSFATDLSFTMDEFARKFPDEGESLKRKLASLVLQNAYTNGGDPLIVTDVRVSYGQDLTQWKVRLATYDGLKSMSSISSERFLTASLMAFPLRNLENDLTRMESIDPLKKYGLQKFMSEPENVRWAIQMYQLQKVVGAEVLQKEIKIFMLKSPTRLGAFIKKWWNLKKVSTEFDGRCLLFYK